MLVFDLNRLLALRNVKQGRAYLLNHGFTANETRLLLSGKAKSLKVQTTERLCAIFSCEPSDLFTWTGDMNSSMARLRRSAVPRIEELLEGRSPAEIEELLRKLSGE